MASIGLSRGAELALQVGALDRRVAAVVAGAPSSMRQVPQAGGVVPSSRWPSGLKATSLTLWRCPVSTASGSGRCRSAIRHSRAVPSRPPWPAIVRGRWRGEC
ncbi:hypothetical protein BKM31_14260 [[Actinomadura] parvosata subsp. kistnae]|uniref:Uncharacterized protein n=1 Tax=[Actinomadura] parvosata subsp. kistnae TaxID=1909395 RepID=A0A1U9ZX27_9ACTN|nr:hypothetical protein BKM31_14260 [Nonomuraea sp. ATCC 55076]